MTPFPTKAAFDGANVLYRQWWWDGHVIEGEGSSISNEMDGIYLVIFKGHFCPKYGRYQKYFLRNN
jgi:hypothetical protein